MAIIHGSDSTYLIRQGTGHKRVSKWALYLICGISGIAAGFSINLVASDSAPASAKIGLFAVFGLVYFGVCYALLMVYSRRSLAAMRFARGIAGEALVFMELSRLPDSYHVFRDVVIGKGNIDFVVVRPNEVFCIEAKSHRGRVGFNGYRLTNNGREFAEKDFLAQAMRESEQLKEYIQQKTMQVTPVIPLLVFANPNAWVDLPFAPVRGGVRVVHARMLNKFLLSYPARSQAINIPAIEIFLDSVTANK